MPHPHRVILAFGANLGDRAGTIRAALARLAATPGVAHVATSPLYASDPVGYADQPEFVNGVAAFDTSLAPEPFLALLLATEAAFGRVRAIPNGPRTLDLDVLFYDGLGAHTSPTLTLPHPRWRERCFVTVPLAALLASPPLATDSRWGTLRTELGIPAEPTGLRPL